MVFVLPVSRISRRFPPPLTYADVLFKTCSRIQLFSLMLVTRRSRFPLCLTFVVVPFSFSVSTSFRFIPPFPRRRSQQVSNALIPDFSSTFQLVLSQIPLLTLPHYLFSPGSSTRTEVKSPPPSPFLSRFHFFRKLPFNHPFFLITSFNTRFQGASL